MRTTVTLDDHLLAEAKRLAAESGRSVSEVIADALRESLARRDAARARPRAKLPTSGGGGVRPGVDLDSWASLLDVMEDDDVPR